MRSSTDIFECNDASFDNVFASEHHGKIEIKLEMFGELGVVMLTKDQAKKFAKQLIEMCETEQ